MASQNNKTLMRLLYPFMFMLKEGPEIKGNPFDYSLLIVLTKSETLPSPLRAYNEDPSADLISKVI